MSAKRKPVKPQPKSHISWKALLIPAAVLLLLFVGSFGFAASMEENDSFCASCHTQPESTYFTREQTATAVDLATFHHSKDTRCIDCHSGEGLNGRFHAILMGSRNALAFFTGTAIQPAPLTQPIGDDNCIKCHQNVLTREDFNNHFHAFLQRWQAADAGAGKCTSCHTGHNLGADQDIKYLDQKITVQVCEGCHNVLGGGE